jgi:hypothetical protein
MWLFTSKAFVSIVADRKDSSRLLVRAREQGAIEELFPEAEVFEDLAADYRYRAFLSRDAVRDRVAAYVEGIAYDNFKNSIPHDKAAYHAACNRVWGVMYGLQER